VAASFTKEVSEDLFKKRFILNGFLMLKYFLEPLFFGREKAIHKMHEVPLKSWIEKEILK
jgi:hypothetical protein